MVALGIDPDVLLDSMRFEIFLDTLRHEVNT